MFNLRRNEQSSRFSRRNFLQAFIASPIILSAGCSIFNKPKELDPSVYQRAVEKTTDNVVKELERLTKINNGKKPIVCFIGVLGVSAEAISNATRAKLARRDEIQLIEKSKMTAALKESNIRASEIFIPAQRKLFANALNEPFNFILAGYVEDIEEKIDPNDENSKTIPKTVFRLELFDLDSNKTFEFTEEL